MRLTVERLTLSRGDRVLVRDLCFELRPGEAVVLTGANGSGKTTLLRAVAGLVRADAGAVRFDAGDSALEAEEARGRLHWLGWRDALKSGRSARAEARFWAGWAGADEAAADAALAQAGLAEAGTLDVRRLSTGQRRRLSMTRLLAAPRALWVLDEPLAPLDAGWRERFAGWLGRHLDGGGSALIAAHDRLPVAAREIVLRAPA